MDNGGDSENSRSECRAQRGVSSQADNQAASRGLEQPAGVGCTGNDVRFKTAGGYQLSFESILASY
jgi:hypothetical protein